MKTDLVSVSGCGALDMCTSHIIANRCPDCKKKTNCHTRVVTLCANAKDGFSRVMYTKVDANVEGEDDFTTFAIQGRQTFKFEHNSIDFQSAEPENCYVISNGTSGYNDNADIETSHNTALSQENENLSYMGNVYTGDVDNSIRIHQTTLIVAQAIRNTNPPSNIEGGYKVKNCTIESNNKKKHLFEFWAAGSTNLRIFINNNSLERNTKAETDKDIRKHLFKHERISGTISNVAQYTILANTFEDKDNVNYSYLQSNWDANGIEIRSQANGNIRIGVSLPAGAEITGSPFPSDVF